jgi:Amt family ammonium transporter
VWNVNGWLHLLGTLDFAGGIVIHAAAGLSALAAALVIGRRQDVENHEEMKPGNIPYVILGASILWFGWFGFNAGSALAADTVAVYALVNTNLAAAAAAVSWMAVDWMGKGRPSVVGLAVGAVCGLAAVTPASGYVAPWAAILIGMTAGVVSNLVSNWRASSLKVDDTLDVFACHGVGGIIGSLATGLFATVAVNATGSNGLLYGNTNLFFAQFVGVVVVGAYSFIGTYVILKVINIFSPLRVTPDEERKGLDLVEHGEEAYSQQD